MKSSDLVMRAVSARTSDHVCNARNLHSRFQLPGWLQSAALAKELSKQLVSIRLGSLRHSRGKLPTTLNASEQFRCYSVFA